MNFLNSWIPVICFLFSISTASNVAPITIAIDPLTTFMYFAYGSNLLSKRILIHNPTAQRRAIGRLENYRLDFNIQSPMWNGSVATIVEDDHREVWGAIWEMNISSIDDLDRQEGVESNSYKAIEINIKTLSGKSVTCRSYQQLIVPKDVYRLEDLPIDRRPSKTYRNCIVKGAEESLLPSEYINELRKVPHNNQEALDRTLREMDLEWYF